MRWREFIACLSSGKSPWFGTHQMPQALLARADEVSE